MDDHEDPLRGRKRVEALAGRICAQAGQEAQATCRLVEMIGEFDAAGGIGYVRGVKTVAHWLSWSCSMSPGVAREHVRVARALRQMPTVTTAFRAGVLSYSKVREATRVVGLVDEARLCELARTATASQLARMISGFRAASGTRIAQQEERRLTLVAHADQQMTGLSGRLPTEEAGIVAAALRTARDNNQAPPQTDNTDPADQNVPEPSATPTYTDADALLDICRHYLATAATADESGEDRHVMVVEVAAEQLDAEPVADHGAENVPAETRGTLQSQVCSVRGVGGIEPATAARLACTGTVLGAVVDAHGDVLALGRSRRLVSKTQRRALMIRDRMCQFPGCAQDRHLDAHHIVLWSRPHRSRPADSAVPFPPHGRTRRRHPDQPHTL